MKTLFIATGALFAVLSMSSCVNRIADLTVASTKNMDLNSTKGYCTSNNQRVRGEDLSHTIIVFPTGSPDLKEAIDRAIHKSGDNCVGLSNVAIYSKTWYIPFIYGQQSIIAEGDPIMKK